MTGILNREIKGLIYLNILIIINTFSESNYAFDLIEDNITHYVSGVLITSHKDSFLLHDTFVPVVYEIDLPDWMLSDFNIEWPGNFSSECENSDIWGDNWNQMACPVSFHMDNVTDHFFKSILDWKMFNSSLKSEKIQFSSCNEILPHFKSFFIGHEEKDEYLHEDLKNCPIGQIIYEKLSVPWQEVNSTMYSTMLSRFIEESVLPSKYRITGFSKYAVATNAYSVFQIGQLLDYIYTSSKWSQAMSHCNSELIPLTLISKETLGLALQEIERTVISKENYKFTISPKDFSTYYKLPIADCAFTTKNSLIVRILIPLKKSLYHYQLSQLQTIPFLRVKGDISQICEISGSVSKQVLIEKFSGGIIPIKCKAGSLCLIPDLASRPVMDLCLIGLVKNDTVNILNHCDIKCNYFDTTQLPYFRRLSTDKYAILGKSQLEVFVSCESKPYKVVTPPVTIGALEVTLPCDCQLVHLRESLHAMTPCDKELVLRVIMPVQWSPNSKSKYHYYHINHERALESQEEIYDKTHGSISSQNVILAFIIVILFSLNIVLILAGNHLYTRVCKIENSNSQRVNSNFYETPMFNVCQGE